MNEASFNSRMKPSLLNAFVMKVLKFTTTIDESGHLHLDIPTELSSGQVDVVVILNSSSSGSIQKMTYDFSDLAGQLEWQGDAVSMQRTLRDEW